ncbi:hypothetical protein F5Y05DRAFT_149143 [Hypoxylon sp. FL0543]|nr:hypothetical protein F5Y05DRAFT_149143 [Hypoxylon sp. FL0543]
MRNQFKAGILKQGVHVESNQSRRRITKIYSHGRCRPHLLANALRSQVPVSFLHQLLRGVESVKNDSRGPSLPLPLPSEPPKRRSLRSRSRSLSCLRSLTSRRSRSSRWSRRRRRSSSISASTSPYFARRRALPFLVFECDVVRLFRLLWLQRQGAPPLVLWRLCAQPVGPRGQHVCGIQLPLPASYVFRVSLPLSQNALPRQPSPQPV